jgi:hypothetical protein
MSIAWVGKLRIGPTAEPSLWVFRRAPLLAGDAPNVSTDSGGVGPATISGVGL